ncbi:hypothetical protein DD559_08555 [Sphingomonas pokkalii]|uniref:Transposase n=1 Tax=Sphingomonas pokkalii TaxID=2175090 RepID=A0A2U0SDA7_9SPHN|nr:hypothetical protein DD559_08555 [Sphingomonas pokkalii]
MGIAEQPPYRWRKEYGGLKVDQSLRMNDPERENSRLKKLVADLALDKAFLQKASKLTFCPAPVAVRRSSRFVVRYQYRSGGPAVIWVSTARPSVIRQRATLRSSGCRPISARCARDCC